MGLSSTSVGVGCSKVDAPVKVQRAIGVDVDIQSLVVSGCVDVADVASLHEVVGNDDVLLVGSHFDVVRSDAWLVLVWVVQALWVVEVGDVERSNVVRSCDGCYICVSVWTLNGGQ